MEWFIVTVVLVVGYTIIKIFHDLLQAISEKLHNIDGNIRLLHEHLTSSAAIDVQLDVRDSLKSIRDDVEHFRLK